MMFVLAHFGHWYVSLIYAAPVVVLGGLIAFDMYRHRGEEEAGVDEPPEAPTP